MDTILETNAAVESVRQAYDGKSDRPRPEWVRGICPQCGDQLVSNCYYVGARRPASWRPTRPGSSAFARWATR